MKRYLEELADLVHHTSPVNSSFKFQVMYYQVRWELSSSPLHLRSKLPDLCYEYIKLPRPYSSFVLKSHRHSFM